MRCFIAAFLSPGSASTLEQRCAEWLDAGVGGVALHPLAPEDYHVTLKFLGDVPASAAAGLLDAVAALDAGPVDAVVTGITGFPRPQAARVVVAELAPHAQLDAWWAALERRFGVEGRGFRPHVSLARCQRPRPVAERALARPLRIELAAPALYCSDRGPDGRRYRAVVAAD